MPRALWVLIYLTVQFACNGPKKTRVDVSPQAAADVLQIESVLGAFERDLIADAPSIGEALVGIESRLTNEDLLVVANAVASLRQSELEDREWDPDAQTRSVINKLADLPYFRDLPNIRLVAARLEGSASITLTPPQCSPSCRVQRVLLILAEVGVATHLNPLYEIVMAMKDAAHCGEAIQTAQSCFVRETCTGDLVEVVTTCGLLAASLAELTPQRKLLALLLDIASVMSLLESIGQEAREWEQECLTHQATECRPDAGVPDAATSDAAPSDGAVDAALTDGPVDAMSPDASTCNLACPAGQECTQCPGWAFPLCRYSGSQCCPAPVGDVCSVDKECIVCTATAACVGPTADSWHCTGDGANVISCGVYGGCAAGTTCMKCYGSAYEFECRPTGDPLPGNCIDCFACP